MRMTRAWLGLSATCALLAWASAGCGNRSIAGSGYKDPHPLPQDTLTFTTREIGTYGGRFVIGQTNPPKTFNDIMSNETSSTDIAQRLNAGLADFNYETQTEYAVLAKSWEVSADGTVWTWHLRRGAAFSDGHPITSEDVLFCFEVAYDDELHPSIQDLLMLDGKKFEVSAPDSYTVVMKIPRPYALMVPAVGSLRIMPKHILEPAYRAGTFASAYNVSTSPDSIVTSGAWTLKQYVPNEKTVLARNPYWLGVDSKGQRLPYLDELVFLIVPDQEAATLKFQAGEIDAIDDVKPEDYKAYTDGQAQGHYTLHDLGPGLNTNFFWFNLNRVRKTTKGKKVGDLRVDPVKYAWFSRKEFRQACSKAIDRDAMIRSVFYGEAVKNWSTSTPGNKTWYTPEAAGLDYDLEGAKQLLAGLGWRDRDGDGYLEDEKGNTISFTLKTNASNVMRVAMANFIKDDLAKIGVKVLPSPVDFNTLIANLRENFEYECILLGLQSAVPPDPGMGQNVWKSSGLTHYWNIEQPKPETPTEARIDALMGQNVGTTDMAVRRQTWKEIQQLVNDETFMIWLPTIKVKVPVRDRFGNVSPSVIPHRILWNIERLYVKSKSPAA